MLEKSEMIANLMTYFEKPLNQVALGVYLDGLARLDAELVEPTYHEIVATSKWMPRVSEILDTARRVQDRLDSAAVAEWADTARAKRRITHPPGWQSIGLGGYVRGDYDPAVACVPLDPEIEQLCRIESAERLGVNLDNLDQAMEEFRIYGRISDGLPTSL
jgi:hypothetical protein